MTFLTLFKPQELARITIVRFTRAIWTFLPLMMGLIIHVSRFTWAAASPVSYLKDDRVPKALLLPFVMLLFSFRAAIASW